MREIRYVKPANDDLVVILTFLVDRRAASARTFRDQLDRVARMLAREPGIGRRENDRIRSFPFRGYRIFYEVTGDELIVHRVWSMRRGGWPDF